jgi:hypothetical protein
MRALLKKYYTQEQNPSKRNKEPVNLCTAATWEARTLSISLVYVDIRDGYTFISLMRSVGARSRPGPFV